jgi:hypothetical protein
MIATFVRCSTIGPPMSLRVRIRRTHAGRVRPLHSRKETLARGEATVSYGDMRTRSRGQG